MTGGDAMWLLLLLQEKRRTGAGAREGRRREGQTVREALEQRREVTHLGVRVQVDGRSRRGGEAAGEAPAAAKAVHHGREARDQDQHQHQEAAAAAGEGSRDDRRTPVHCRVCPPCPRLLRRRGRRRAAGGQDRRDKGVGGERESGQEQQQQQERRLTTAETRAAKAAANQGRLTTSTSSSMSPAIPRLRRRQQPGKGARMTVGLLLCSDDEAGGGQQDGRTGETRVWEERESVRSGAGAAAGEETHNSGDQGSEGSSEPRKADDQHQ